MTSEQFCYWLQGFFEISNGDVKGIAPEKAQIIQDHLDLVFNKVTPDRKGIEISEIENFKYKKGKNPPIPEYSPVPISYC